MTDLRYPIGPRPSWTSFTPASRAAAIDAIADTPAAFRRAVAGFTDAQLDTPYRPGGWTVRQVVHHLADAHMVMSTRIRTALTEDNPPVKMWDEVTWAELSDAKSMPVEGSLAIIDAVHARLANLLRALAPEQFGRTTKHPDWDVISVDWLVELCAWHGKHHTAHASEFRKRNGAL